MPELSKQKFLNLQNSGEIMSKLKELVHEEMTIDQIRDVLREMIILPFDSGRHSRDVRVQEKLDAVRHQHTRAFVNWIDKWTEDGVKSMPAFCVMGSIDDMALKIGIEYSAILGYTT